MKNLPFAFSALAIFQIFVYCFTGVITDAAEGTMIEDAARFYFSFFPAFLVFNGIIIIGSLYLISEKIDIEIAEKVQRDIKAGDAFTKKSWDERDYADVRAMATKVHQYKTIAKR